MAVFEGADGLFIIRHLVGKVLENVSLGIQLDPVDILLPALVVRLKDSLVTVVLVNPPRNENERCIPARRRSHNRIEIRLEAKDAVFSIMGDDSWDLTVLALGVGEVAEPLRPEPGHIVVVDSNFRGQLSVAGPSVLLERRSVGRQALHIVAVRPQCVLVDLVEQIVRSRSRF